VNRKAIEGKLSEAPGPVEREYSRYYALGGGHGTSSAQLRGILLIGLSVAAAALWRTPIVMVPAAILAVVGVAQLVRPARPGVYVEVREKELVLNVLFPIRIPFENIQTVSHPPYRDGAVMRLLVNCAVALNRLTGGDLPWWGRKGEIDRSSVEVRFKKRMWVFVPIPPFYWPRAFWYLTVENAPLLKDELEGGLLELSQKRTC
jgi:hypothetical protein